MASQAQAATSDTHTPSSGSELGTLIVSELSSFKTEVTGGLTSQMRNLSSDVGELRRGLADCVTSLAALQGQVKGLVASSSPTAGSPYPPSSPSHNAAWLGRPMHQV